MEKNVEVTDEANKVGILMYTKKENARVYDIWGTYPKGDSLLTETEGMLKRNGFHTKVTYTTHYASVA